MPTMRIGPTQIALGVLIFLQLWFLVNGSSYFSGYWQATNLAVWMPVYLILTIGTLAFSTFAGGPAASAAGGPFGDPLGILPLAAMLFLGSFLISLALFQFPAFRIPLNLPTQNAVASVAFNFGVVSFTEELAFRWLLIGLLYRITGPWLAVGISSAAWAGFHFAAYGEQPASLLFIFILGIGLGALYLVTRRYGGIAATWGFHFGWNLGVSGLLTLVH